MTQSIVEYMAEPQVRENIVKTLGANKTNSFIANVASLASGNEALMNCDKKSLMLACLTATTLDLPINQNLGFAYIIAYKDKAQFQMGYKGFIQLAQRSGKFKTINVTDVKEGEIKSLDRLTGDIAFEWAEDRLKLQTVGYVAYMELLNGFKKSLYMTVKELEGHGNKYSQTAKRGFGLWKDDFDAMASKTVIKLLLARYAPMTVDIQKAQLADQAVIVDEDQYEYVDNKPILAGEIAQGKEVAKIIKHIEDSKTIEELQMCEEFLTTPELQDKFNEKLKEFKQ